MNAIMQERYGSADVLKLRKTEPPVIVGDDDVVIQVMAAGMDPSVWHLMTGLPYLVRLMGYGLRRPKKSVPGSDVAGVVVAVGKKVTRFQPGDPVFGTCRGAFAQYASARESWLVPKPDCLTFQEAAAVPVSCYTALQAVRDAGKVAPGQEVLVIGAAGGVGSFAVQIAKAFGAKVTGVCSTTGLGLVKSLGADRTVDYTREEVTDGRQQFDVILDTAGNRSLSSLRRILTPKGRLVIVGGEGGGRWFGAMGRSLYGMLLNPFGSQRFEMLMATYRQEDLHTLTGLIETGKVKPVIDRTYPLEQAPEAIRAWERGHARGKVVINVTEADPAPIGE